MVNIWKQSAPHLNYPGALISFSLLSYWYSGSLKGNQTFIPVHVRKYLQNDICIHRSTLQKWGIVLEKKYLQLYICISRDIVRNFSQGGPR